MVIAKPCVVTLTWTLADAQGEPLDELGEPTEFLFGGDDLLPRLEEALDGREPGAELDVYLEPEHAFGEYDPDLVCFESRTLFPEGTEPGMRFEGLPPGAATSGMPDDVIYTVTEVYPEHVVLDGNHPLAGIALRLHVTVLDVRQATEEEAQAGSVGEQLLTLAGGPDGSSGLGGLHGDDTLH
jgi:FKBP-type peptidyl-prolyl cis-trans isomerase SlyD